MQSKQPSILIGITGGIAAYKVVDVVADLRQEGLTVRVVMTEHAMRIISPETFAKASGNPVISELFPQGFDYRSILKTRSVNHIQLADSSDMFLIAPATANCIAKLAYGFADDVLTTIALAATCPILICPSMNVHMWQHPATQENIKRLIRRGVYMLYPDEGDLACGYTGTGRLPDLQRIKAEARHMLRTCRQLVGKRALVTAGGTSEPIDGVRVITNRASGKMGYAIAQECRMRGAEVLLIGRNATSCDATFETADDLEKLLRRYVPQADMIFHTAAVSDFTPVLSSFRQATVEARPVPIKSGRSDLPRRLASLKLRRSGQAGPGQARMTKSCKLDSSLSHTLTLTPREKIISKIKTWNPKAILVGFKAVYQVDEGQAMQAGRVKMKESGADVMVVNDVGRRDIGFDAEDNEGYILSSKNKQKKLSKKNKLLFAREIIDFILSDNNL